MQLQPFGKKILIVSAILLSHQVIADDDNFGAIAYSLESGAYGYATNYSTQQEAEEVALKACLEESEGAECAVELWFKNAYGALAEGENGFGTGWGVYKQEAQLNALNVCKQHTTNCDITLTVGTD